MTFVSNTQDALAFIADDYARLQARLDEAVPKPKKLESYDEITKIHLLQYRLEAVNDVGVFHSLTFSNHNDCCPTISKVIERRDNLCAILDKALLDAEVIRGRNVEIIEHNKLVIAKVTDLMAMMGVAAKYSETYQYRGKTKYQDKPAGYVTDLARVVPTKDHYHTVVSEIRGKRQAIVDWAFNRLTVLREEEKKRVSAELAKTKELFLATAKVRYNLGYDANELDVLRAIVTSNKYLALGYAMYSLRVNGGGWTVAKSLLDQFPIEDRTDAEIAADIQKCIDGWEGDARIFRDTKWGYEALISLCGECDSQSLLDYQTYQELFENDF